MTLSRTPSVMSSLAVCTVLATVTAAGQVTTSQYNNARTGADLTEVVLTPKNVNSARFGKLFSLPVDGDIYAQPLFFPGVDIPGKGRHNVVFVATEHDSVFAFDADVPSASTLWQVSFLHAGVTTVPEPDVRCPFIHPEVGITPTPVIDRDTGTLYVLARTKETQGVFRQGQYVQRLHALAMTTGVEKFGGPIEIKASVTGRGTGGSRGQVAFDPLRQLPRASLLLTHGQVYLTWASSCDVGPYHGWVMAYDARTLSQTAVLNTSPDAGESGVWQGDTGPAADVDGHVFVTTGNGQFDAAGGGRDYGDSVLKLTLGTGGLMVGDFFTPYDQEKLNTNDLDLGSGGPMLLPDEPGRHPQVLLAGGKEAFLYVVDRNRMGRYHAGDDSQVIQVLQVGSRGIYSAPAYWNHHVYILAANDVIRDYAVNGGQLSARPVAQGVTKFPDPGATPTISANGSRDGIVWVIRSRGWRSPDTPAVLYAYDATNVAHELYNSEQNTARDRAALCLRFNIPTVANGRVYLGAKKEVDVYGLLAPSSR